LPRYLKGVSPASAASKREQEQLSDWIFNPVRFVSDVIIEPARQFYNYNLTDQQISGLRAIGHTNFLTIKAGRGPGKTAWLSMVILWFMATRPSCRIMVTGPKFEQLKKTIWPELKKWLDVSLISGDLSWTAQNLWYKGDQAGRFAFIATSKDEENLAGLHDDHMLFVVDEASNVRRTMIEALIAGMTHQDNKIILAGNPTQTSSFFYDSHNKFADIWTGLTWNSEESPIVSKNQIEMLARKWGKESDMYRVQVLGEFPKGNPDCFIPLADLEAARARVVRGEAPMEIGVDPARLGENLSAITTRHGFKVLPQRCVSGVDSWELAILVIEELRKWRKEFNVTEKVKIKVDDTGGGGLCDVLRNNPEFKNDNFEVVAINFTATGDEHYKGITSLMWGTFKEALPHVELPDDDDLVNELAARKVSFDKGRACIEEKKDFKNRMGGQSPDRSDSLILAFARSNVKMVLDGIGTSSDISEEVTIERISSQAMYWDNFGAAYEREDMGFSIIMAAYDPIEEKLCIYDELITDYPQPETAPDIRSRLTKVNPSWRFLAHKDMAEKKNTELLQQFRRFGLKMEIPMNYNENAAIVALRQLQARQKLKILKTCIHSTKQVMAWKVGDSKTNRDQFPLCYALLLIVSQLRRNVATSSPYHMRKPFSKSGNVYYKGMPKYKVRGMI